MPLFFSPQSRNLGVRVRRCIRNILSFLILGLLCAGIRIAEAGQTIRDTHPDRTYSGAYLNVKPEVEYVGDDACRNCHSSVYENFKKTGMGRSTSIPSTDDLRDAAESITIENKKLNRAYRVYAQGGKLIHEEHEPGSDGRTVFSEKYDIAFTVGAGDMGKSYLVFKGDSLFLSPISYYNSISGWDLSPGYKEGLFHGFNRRAVALCVDCHTGMPRFAPGDHDRLAHPAFRFLAIGCERCHGPGSLHVALRSLNPYIEGSLDPSIVNPSKLQVGLRDEVCMQCHVAGDARVLQPGKDYLDFRPGTSLGDVVAIYSVPQAIKGNHFVLLDQFEQMKLSRCWNASNGRLGCISCHDPHVQRKGNEEATFFRDRCLTCHTNASCKAPRASRLATAPADNCVLCHMPKQKSERIDHTSITDHRILRTQSEIPLALQEVPSLDLIPDTKSSDPDAMQNLRTLAIAYAEVGARYPEYDAKALQALELAAAAFPSDAEVQATYGKALVLTHSQKIETAADALKKAIDLGSNSPEVRTLLAGIRIRQGQVGAAITLYGQSIHLDPYYLAAYIDLAHAYSTQSDSKNALKTLDQLLQLDPGNDAAREERAKIARVPNQIR